MAAEMREMRNALESLIVMRPEKVITSESGESQDRSLDPELSSRLVGSWINKETGSQAYAKEVGNKLSIVYCFCGNSEARGVYHDLHQVGDRIYARFHWIKTADISGFTILSFADYDTLKVGWWYETVSTEVLENIALLAPEHLGMIPIEWTRVSNQPVPSWATEWFETDGRKRR